MNYILFDDETRVSLLPFTFTRPVGEIRVGILTIREKWERHFDQPVSHSTEKYLREKYPLAISGDDMFINGSVLPDKNLVSQIAQLKEGEKLVKDQVLLAV